MSNWKSSYTVTLLMLTLQEIPVMNITLRPCFMQYPDLLPPSPDPETTDEQ